VLHAGQVLEDLAREAEPSHEHSDRKTAILHHHDEDELARKGFHFSFSATITRTSLVRSKRQDSLHQHPTQRRYPESGRRGRTTIRIPFWSPLDYLKAVV